MGARKNSRDVLAGLFALVLVAGVVGIAVYWLGTQFDSVSPLIWTTLAGGGGYLIRARIERRRAHERLLADHKREQYFQLLDFMNEFFGDAVPDKSRIKELRRWSLRLMVVGSDDVLRNWNVARTQASISDPPHGDASDEPNLQALRLWGKPLLSMRRDCGHFGTQLGVTDVLGSILNDYEQHRAQLERD